MKHRTLALLALGTSLACAITVGACSSDDDVTPPKDGGIKDQTLPPSDTGGGTDSGKDASDSAPPDGGADCATPNTIFSTPDAGPYCPFQADSGFFSCVSGQHCCVYSVSSGLDSECKAGASACNPAGIDGGADFECNESADCPGGSPVCCLLGLVKQDAVCKEIYFGSLVNGTKCRNNTCQGTEVQLCNADGGAACPTSTVCRPFKTKAISLGGCVP